MIPPLDDNIPIFASLADFREKHLDVDQRIRRYLEIGRADWQTLTRQERCELDRQQAQFWYSNNAYARGQFAEVVTRKFGEFERAFASDIGLNMVTLIPGRYAVPLESAASFDTRSLMAWTRQELHGFEFIAMVEAAFYGNAGRYLAGRSRKTVSFHVHAWVWGADQRLLSRKMSNLNRRCEAMLPSVRVAVISPIDRENWLPRLLYLLKNQLVEYRIYPDLAPITSEPDGEVTLVPTGRIRQRKQNLRPGDTVRMFRAMSGRTLDQLLFAGGDGGRALLTTIKREMLTTIPRSLRTSADQNFLDRTAPRP